MRYVLQLAGMLLIAGIVSDGLAGGRGNRLTHLDLAADPYYVHGEFPRLLTPQWVGEEGVDAVVVLAIDDLRDTARYEAFLRPILNRLQQADAASGLSIMTVSVDPHDPQLQTWLSEGVTLEVHTLDHPCPLLANGRLDTARATYERCLELLTQIPGNEPVAFRLPCCDSQNTPSPRFWTEIFSRRSPEGKFLAIDSSVFNVTTAADPSLPPNLTTDEAGRPRFEKYLPFPSFVNRVDNYPYPYVIDQVCWEIPCIVPSDWEAQHLQQPNNPQTVTDLQAALDVAVHKQGVFSVVFHPHGWIRNDQIVQLIDYAATRYGRRVRFLNFREVLRRLNHHFLADAPLRNDDGTARGVRVLDINDDGYMDVIVPHLDGRLTTRLWVPHQQIWREFTQPIPATLRQFGVLNDTAPASFVAIREDGLRIYDFAGETWIEQPLRIAPDALPSNWRKWLEKATELDAVRLRDVDGDGVCELLTSHGQENLILTRTAAGTWQQAAYRLPFGVQLALPGGKDAGLRFVDINGDGNEDCLFSNGQSFSLHLFASPQTGWSRPILQGNRSNPTASTPVIPAIIRQDGSNNGVWFHSRHLWVQNEDTSRMPDRVDRLSFDDMLRRRADGPVLQTAR